MRYAHRAGKASRTRRHSHSALDLAIAFTYETPARLPSTFNMETLNPTTPSAETYPILPFFETSPNLMCIAGFDGYFKRINPAVCKALEYTSEELMARPIREFIHPDDLENTTLQRESILNGKPLINYENRYITKSGETIWLSWNSIPVEGSSLVYAIAKNISHIKAREAERNRLLKELSRKNVDLEHLSYQTAHDIRSPVAALLSVLSLIDISVIDDPETVEILGMIENSATDLEITLDSYLHTLRRKHTALIALESLDIQEVFDAAIRPINSLIVGAQASIELDLAPDCQNLLFNRSYLQSIFLNLTTNSIKYAHPQRPPVIKIKITCSEDGKKIMEFSDNGIGFDAQKHREQLFEFNQTFHDREDSKGVGLYLVRQHVESMGGKISVSSKVNQGTTFTLQFKET